MNTIEILLLRRKQLELSISIMREELKGVNDAIKQTCNHHKVKDNKIFHSGDYYNKSWVEVQVTCLDCGHVLNTFEDKGYSGYYG